MEGRAPAGPAQKVRAPVRAPAAPRKWLLFAVLATLLALAGIALWSWLSQPKDEFAGGDSAEPSTPLPASVSDHASSDAAGAMIVEDPAAHAAAAEALTPAPTVPPPAGAAGEPLAAVPGDAGKPATAATTKPRPAGGKAAAPPAKQGREDSEDLLGTLLGIIKQDPNKPKHESMDALVAQIQADDKRAAAEGDAAMDTIDPSAGRTSNDSGIQAQLRRCPKANTVEGMECRRKVCANVAGKDPACPASR
ncbi:hypothetical protein CKY51_05790 [Xanthomonas maliensis]|nr:hypothetical protein CKY51_05790 [Xanthomonas maliensis]